MKVAKVDAFNAVEPLEHDEDINVNELAREGLKVNAIDANPSDQFGADEDPLSEEAQNGIVRLSDFLKKRQALKGDIDPKVWNALTTYIKVRDALGEDHLPGIRFDTRI